MNNGIRQFVTLKAAVAGLSPDEANLFETYRIRDWMAELGRPFDVESLSRVAELRDVEIEPALARLREAGLAADGDDVALTPLARRFFGGKITGERRAARAAAR